MSEVPAVPSSDADPGGGSGASRRPVLLAALGVAVLLIVVLVVFAVTGDDDTDDVSSGGDTEETASFWGATWRIVSITEDGQDITPDLPEGKDLFDTTEEGRISFTGCNGASGGASLDGDTLVVEDMMQTQMACMDEEGQVLMDHDAFMVAFLGGGPTVSIDGDQLTLTGADATIVLEPAPAVSGSTTLVDPGDPGDPGDPDTPVSSEGAFWGSTWTITTIVDDGAEVEVVDAQASGAAPEIDTTAEGAISFTGCNGGRGEANYGAGKLAVGPLVSTKMACEDAALMSQDDFIASLLASAPTVSVEGDTLVLAADQDQLVATRQS
jgi:heat shock protein HslJ